MQKILFIFLSILSSFVFNIFIYYISPDYRFFLQKLRNNNVIEIDKNLNNKETVDLGIVWSGDNLDWYDINILDIKKNKFAKDEGIYIDINEDKISNVIIDEVEKNWNDLKSKVEFINLSNNNIKDSLDNVKEKKDIENYEILTKIENVEVTNTEKEFLNKFKGYDLILLELHTRLFDLTSEYPDDYKEYYSEYLSIYFFWNKPYGELKDIFNVLTYELPFSIKEVNNFWLKSFYINLNEEFDDWFIRIIILYKNRTVWIKIHKNVYDDIKSKLVNLEK